MADSELTLTCSSSEPQKRGEVAGTPSTDCGDEGVDLRAVELGVSPLESQRLSSAQVERTAGQTRKARGLTKDQFLTAVREPFSFPSSPVLKKDSGEILVAVPVCFICQQRMIAGDWSRELVACGHCFHAGCVEVYLTNHTHCPVCRTRCKLPSGFERRKLSCSSGLRRANSTQGRICWTPEYDMQLLSITEKAGILRQSSTGKLERDSSPISEVFLKTSLPVLLEECQDYMDSTDGSLSCLCTYLNEEKQKRILSSICLWNKDMRKLAIAFLLSVINMYMYQKEFVGLYIDLVAKKEDNT